jgi:hypothetical protein
VSAYQLGPIHIDAMLTGLLVLTGGPGQHVGPLQWLDPAVRQDPAWIDGYEPGAPMGPDANALFDSYGHQLTATNATRVGTMLLAENARSISFRYARPPTTSAGDYVFKYLPGTPTVPVVAGIINTYVYQACEHPLWPGSEAHAFVIAARTALLDCICTVQGEVIDPAIFDKGRTT